MTLADLENFLNSNWAFGLTQTGARRRRFFITALGAVLWALVAILYNPLPWDPGTSQRMLFYPLRALFNLGVFPIILLLSLFYGLALFLAPRYLPELRQPLRRFTVLVAVLLGILWGALAYHATPPDWGSNISGSFLAYPLNALFAPHIFRHVLVAGLALWFAFRAASIYLDDIFELENIPVAQRFILQAAFGSGYNTISIQNGAIPWEQRDSPIVRIGGPGWVRVHLENAALFEANDGASRVIGPTGERRNDAVELAPFERLREVIDLRDQMDDLSVQGRTSDGVKIRAEDVNVVYSVYRNNQPSTLEVPYPYDPEALQRLYYSQARKDVVREAMIGLIRKELARFISKHSLNEFLASTSIQDLQEAQAQNLASESDEGEEIQPPPPNPAFVTRPQMITDLFAAQFARQARSTGMELKWIGVGTWVTPDEIIPQKHREAWRMTIENLVRGSENELARIRRETEMMEFLRLVQEVPVVAFRQNQDLSATDRMRQMIIAYHSRLNEVYETLTREDRLPEERARLRNVLVFLSRFTTRRLRGPTTAATPGGTQVGGLPDGG